MFKFHPSFFSSLPSDAAAGPHNKLTWHHSSSRTLKPSPHVLSQSLETTSASTSFAERDQTADVYTHIHSEQFRVMNEGTNAHRVITTAAAVVVRVRTVLEGLVLILIIVGHGRRKLDGSMETVRTRNCGGESSTPHHCSIHLGSDSSAFNTWDTHSYNATQKSLRCDAQVILLIVISVTPQSDRLNHTRSPHRAMKVSLGTDRKSAQNELTEDPPSSTIVIVVGVPTPSKSDTRATNEGVMCKKKKGLTMTACVVSRTPHRNSDWLPRADQRWRCTHSSRQYSFSFLALSADCAAESLAPFNSSVPCRDTYVERVCRFTCSPYLWSQGTDCTVPPVLSPCGNGTGRDMIQ